MKLQTNVHLSLALLIAMFFMTFSTVLAASAPTSIDFHLIVLPILKDSCFACHLPDGDAVRAAKDTALEKKINKEVGDGIDDFTMDEKFPFPADKSVSKQLKHLENELTQHTMPPKEQVKFGLGLPLSDKNRKLLLDWVIQQKKVFKP
jgi:hypothetical protein